MDTSQTRARREQTKFRKRTTLLIQQKENFKSILTNRLTFEFSETFLIFFNLAMALLPTLTYFRSR